MVVVVWCAEEVRFGAKVSQQTGPATQVKLGLCSDPAWCRCALLAAC